MPWFVFQTPQGQRQLYAETAQQAATMFFQKTGITANPIQGAAGDEPWAGIQFLGGGGVQTAQPGPSPQLQPAVAGTFQSEDTGLGRTGAFRRALASRGVDLGTLAGGSLLGQQGQFEDVFDVLQALGRAPGGERAFETFSQAETQPFAQALGLVQALGRGEFGQGGLTDQLRALLNPSNAEEIGGTARLGQAALRGQVGAFGSNPFLQGAVGRLPGEFAAQSQSQQAAMPFFQFLRRRIGI